MLATALRSHVAFALSRNYLSVRVITINPLVISALVPTQTPTLSSFPAIRQSSGQAGPGIITEGDVVLLKRVSRKDTQVFTKPLKHGRRAQTHFGDVLHSDIINRRAREIVTSSTGKELRIHQPTLAEYVTLTPRQVTPVYPDDANLIVSLLDIHVESQANEPYGSVPTLEILEAGTGHGSLTLHLARAIQAANPPPPLTSDDSTAEGENLWRNWKAKRRAVIHTIDRSKVYSEAAQKIVSGFRKGIYAPHVDFHVGDVSEFITSKVKLAGTDRFFSHIILDLPDVDRHISAGCNALHEDGVLLVFCPSVTQVAKCIGAIREQRLPLDYVQVLELGNGCSGGKQWDVRIAKLRDPTNFENTPAVQPLEQNEGGFIGKALSFFGLIRRSSQPTSEPHPAERWETVCRPSVGHRVVGGGFVGVWRRKKVKEDGADDQSNSRE